MAELDSLYLGTKASPEAVEDFDFRIRRLEGRDWEIAALSPLGRSLALRSPRIELADNAGRTFRTDLDGVNGLVREARLKGYRAEYVGPNEVVRF
jgi:hypothetical protein